MESVPMGFPVSRADDSGSGCGVAVFIQAADRPRAMGRRAVLETQILLELQNAPFPMPPSLRMKDPGWVAQARFEYSPGVDVACKILLRFEDRPPLSDNIKGRAGVARHMQNCENE